MRKQLLTLLNFNERTGLAGLYLLLGACLGCGGQYVLDGGHPAWLLLAFGAPFLFLTVGWWATHAHQVELGLQALTEAIQLRRAKDLHLNTCHFVPCYGEDAQTWELRELLPTRADIIRDAQDAIALATFRDLLPGEAQILLHATEPQATEFPPLATRDESDVVPAGVHA